MSDLKPVNTISYHSAYSFIDSEGTLRIKKGVGHANIGDALDEADRTKKRHKDIAISRGKSYFVLVKKIEYLPLEDVFNDSQRS